LFFLSCSYCCVGWGYVLTFTKVLIIDQIYHTWIHPLHHSPLPPSHIHRILSVVSFFNLHTYVHSTMYVFTLLHYFPTSSPSHSTNPPRQDLFHPLVLRFCKRKNWHFCLLKIATQGISLLHFHVYMYYKPNWLFIWRLHINKNYRHLSQRVLYDYYI
jgi:hypothetical protein